MQLKRKEDINRKHTIIASGKIAVAQVVSDVKNSNYSSDVCTKCLELVIIATIKFLATIMLRTLTISVLIM